MSNTVFSQSPMTHLNNTEIGLANDNYESLIHMSDTIPTQKYNQPILQSNFNSDVIDIRKGGVTNNEPQQVISPLTGQVIGSRDNFLTSTGFNKMNGETYINTINNVPFVGRGTKQNMNPHANESILERYTGWGGPKQKKKHEVESFFDIAPNMGGHINGAPATSLYDGMEDRYHKSRMRNGEKPFQEVRVGPGLNAGYGSKGEGGFQQAGMYDILRAQANRKINNRLANNPKVSYTTPVNAGSLPGGSRGLQAAVVKHKPERWYRNNPDRYFKTGGAVRAARLLPRVIARATNRQTTTKSYYGGAGNGQYKGQMKDKMHRKSRRQNFKNSIMRNLHRGGTWKAEASGDGIGDYGMGSIENKPNERDITTLRTHQLNLATAVKKMIAPLTDIARTTKKEQTIDNFHTGNFSSNVKKLTVHDPNDTMRTTKKEQTIDNFHNGNLTGAKKQTIYDPNDTPRTTIKEQTIHNSNIFANLSPQQPSHLRVYDPEDVAATTLKELTEVNNHTGFIGGDVNEMQPGGYISTSVSAKNTNKQFLSDYYYVGNANSDMTRGGGRGYTTTRMTARATNRQYLTDNEYSGIAGHYLGREKSYSDKYNMTLNPDKEIIEKRYSEHEPTQTGVKLGAGMDFVNINHKKIEGDQINTREPAETSVYQAPPTMNNCGMTTIKEKLPEENIRSRIDSDLLDAFRRNPYSQPLNSVA
jgi:hypothetical protein